jgi:hypothetical protein
MNEINELGQAIGKGIVLQLANYALILLAVSLGFRFASACFGWGTDDSDKNGFYRSGLTIKTDYRTGVQYLSDGKGGLTVRTDDNGKPILFKEGK